MKSNITKGSVWRKWDLQIHAPEAKHGDQYKTDDGSDVWVKFIDCLKNSDIAVFGIADYFSVDSYEKVLGKIKDNNDFKNKTFFPNVELRLDINTNKESEEVNIHLIFDNKCKIEDIKRFLSNLETTSTKNNGTYYCCSPEDLNELGYDKASISLKKLKEALEKTFGKDKPYLKVGAYKGYGGFVYGQPNKQGESERKKVLSDEVDKFCDFVFGTKKDKEWFLKTDRYEDKGIKSAIKPVVASSDCHSFEDCKNFLGKQFEKDGQIIKDITWIKADKTFEGLRQILFEPEDRVDLGYSKPENKKTYFIIDKVRFIDNSGQDDFLPDFLEINQNLTTIIGGKSTGKSLLLYYIAKTIDEQEVETRFENSSSVQYNFDESPNFNFEVVWADGESIFLKNVNNKVEEGQRKILYIPQNYLNKLSEKNIKSRATLNKFVKDVLLQDEAIKNKYEDSNLQIKTLLKTIPTDITSLFQTKQDIVEVEENIKQLGEEKGINKYLDKLKKEADEIKNKSGLKEEEIKEYESLLEKEKQISIDLTILEEDKKSVLAFKSGILQNIENIEVLRDEKADYIGNKNIKDEFKKEFENLFDFKTKFSTSTEKIVSLIAQKIKSKEQELERIKKNLLPPMAKVKLQDELKKKNEAINEEQNKLNKIAIEKKNLIAKKKSYENDKTTITDVYVRIFGIYDSMRNEFKKYQNKFEDISLNVSVGFDSQKFNEEVINNCLNKQDIKRIASNNAKWKDEYEYQYDPSNHLNFVKEIFNAVVEGKIKTIKNKSAKDAIVKILEDYFDLDFKISYKNDPLDKMSPGKKGLVLLRLLIDLSNEEWPILLDQPEDDLDNRSVYDDLVSFIKSKKKMRQVIIVTHNPNLTVGADAEEIIVANQEGQEKGRENNKYKFEYISGALENSFELSETAQKAILLGKGIRQHVCEVLEGGKEAFQKREQKYNF